MKVRSVCVCERAPIPCPVRPRTSPCRIPAADLATAEEGSEKWMQRGGINSTLITSCGLRKICSRPLCDDRPRNWETGHGSVDLGVVNCHIMEIFSGFYVHSTAVDDSCYVVVYY